MKNGCEDNKVMLSLLLKANNSLRGSTLIVGRFLIQCFGIFRQNTFYFKNCQRRLMAHFIKPVIPVCT